MNVRIVIAPDSFKGSLDAQDVATNLAEGLRLALPAVDTELVPMADGGEGTVAALVATTGGRLHTVEATGPRSDKVQAFFGVLGDGATAVIEMASASGLPLLPPDKRDPRLTTTRGTGELILAALDAGCRRIIIGIGGSATNDGGAGMIQALGGHLLDESGNELTAGGAALARLARIDLQNLDPRLAKTEFIVACDVNNPLIGPNGASFVFGPQKGATPAVAAELDKALAHYASVIKTQLGVDVAGQPGAGAAGGLGAGLLAFFQAELRPGVEIVIDTVGLAGRVMDADLVITGEGRIDGQTVFGKTPVGVARLAKRYHKPVIAVAGSVGPGAEDVYAHGIDAIMPIIDSPMPLPKAMTAAPVLLRGCGERIGRLIAIGQHLSERGNAHGGQNH